jgi:protein TonB
MKDNNQISMLGLCIVSAAVLAGFTYQDPNGEDKKKAHAIREIDRVYEQEETPPPPAVVEPPSIQITPDVIEETIEIENTEVPPIVDVTPPVPPPVAEEVIVIAPPVVDFPDVEATFPGGPAAMMKWINDNVKYPQTSIEMNEQGRVFLSFVVEADGSISNVKVERGISPDLDREAKRIIRSMPNWTPGESAGRVVRARCRLPINFQLH